MTGAPLTVRAAHVDDLATIAAIYADAVANTTASFELAPPDVAEHERRWRARGDAFPFLVAELEGNVAGYAYAGAYRERPAYRATCEDSIYIAPAVQRKGVGRALLTALIADCEARGFRQMLGGISGGAASIALHEALGFREVGRLHAVGFKLGRWCDVIWMQRALGAGDTTPP